MRAKSNRCLLWLSPLLLAILQCGILTPVLPSETRAPEAFPKAEIVFVASGRRVGFVNADGADAEYVPLVAAVNGNTSTVWPWRPVITGDNQTLIVKLSDTVDFIFAPHSLALWRPGELPVLCAQWQYQQMPRLAADQKRIMINTDAGLAVHLLEHCGTGSPPETVMEGVTGVPSPDLRYVAFTEQTGDLGLNQMLSILNLDSGAQRSVGEGDYPAWSRDSRWLAYTGPDGIYVVDVEEDALPRRVILYGNRFDETYPTYVATAYWRIPPEVSWSPDNQWLIYHRWEGIEDDQAFQPYDNSIYKLNVETGQEIKVIEHGMYPYWRWPMQEP